MNANASVALPAPTVPPGLLAIVDSTGKLNGVVDGTEATEDSVDFADELSRVGEEPEGDEKNSSLTPQIKEGNRASAVDPLAIACSIQFAVVMAEPQAVPSETSVESTPSVSTPRVIKFEQAQRDTSKVEPREDLGVANSPQSTLAVSSTADEHGASANESAETRTPAPAEQKIAIESESFPSMEPELVASEKSADSAAEFRDSSFVLAEAASSPKREAQNFKPLIVRGIAAAKHEPTMNSAVEMDETAGQMEKNLPGDTLAPNFPAAHAIVRDEARFSSRQDAESHGAIVLGSASPVFSAHPDTKVEQTSPSMSDPAVERVARALLDGVAHLRHTEGDSIVVKITPQPGTEISLRVEMREGTVSAELNFERGDRHLVDANWQELQRRMADQGIQLHRGDDTGARPGSSFHQNFSQSPRRNELPHAERLVAMLPRRGAATPSHTAAPRASRSMLERWA
jgi:hypothetical protein